MAAAKNPTALVESVLATDQRNGEKAFPKFVLGLDGESLKQASHSRVFTIPTSGTLGFWVGQHGPPEAGLFDLDIERNVNWSPVSVRLSDRDNRPLPDVEITILAEPQMARIAVATTDDQGHALIELPNTPCTVVLSSNLESKAIRLRTDQKNLFLVW